MQIVSSIAGMQRLTGRWRQERRRLGFVPTMGYLHEGHLSLVKRARQAAGSRGKVVVSIYVNPTQFAPSEDLSRYPRDLKRDLSLLRGAGADAVFTPDNRTMYPDKAGAAFSTYVVEEQLSQVMEGAARPAHFRGVTTVVAKLFHIVQPDVAVFGQKDFQQAAVLARMVRDLNFPVRLIVAPTRRERDGLAMSSRNTFLDTEQRAQAVILFHALRAAAAAVKKKPQPSARLKADLKKFITAAPLARLDYIAFFDPATLQPVTPVRRGTQMALAVFFGKTRLIDNATL